MKLLHERIPWTLDRTSKGKNEDKRQDKTRGANRQYKTRPEHEQEPQDTKEGKTRQSL